MSCNTQTSRVVRTVQGKYSLKADSFAHSSLSAVRSYSNPSVEGLSFLPPRVPLFFFLSEASQSSIFREKGEKMSESNALKKNEERELLRSESFEEHCAYLAISVQQGLARLAFDSKAQEALALYAGHQLSNAESEDMQLKWYRECCSIAKQGSASAKGKTLQLVEDLDYKSESY